MSERDEKKDDRIDALLEVEVDGMKAGIFGREWCEGCGREGSFTGFIGAMAAHTAGGRFVCASCRQGDLGTGRGGANSALLDGLILGRGFRYCAGCGQQVTLEVRSCEEAGRRPFTCSDCRGQDVVGRARRRYLEYEATLEGGLDRATARVQWARAGIERIVSNPNEE